MMITINIYGHLMKKKKYFLLLPLLSRLRIASKVREAAAQVEEAAGGRQTCNTSRGQRSEAFSSQTFWRQITLTEEDSREPQGGDEDGEIFGTVGPAHRTNRSCRV